MNRIDDRGHSADDSFGWAGASTSVVAALAFGRNGGKPDFGRLRHLALLSNEALALDLSDPAQRQFGDYELLELIGEGGMGLVYRARQASLDREVAIKRLAAGPWASSAFIERFTREAQNAARMQHPNIVAIYEVGTIEDIHFFSMRLVRGQSLAESIREHGPHDPQTTARLMRTVAEAVAYAHSLGVLHLDLKPANILLDENGVPHVADFGLARRLDSTLASDDEEISGTPGYMAPEQVTGEHKLSTATDLWGLGAILHELSTGQPPLHAATTTETLRRLATETVPPPRRLRADLPRDLEAIILKCLQRDPAERYASARELADDLGRFIEHRAVSTRPLSPPARLARWSRREPKLAAASALSLMVLLAGLAATTRQWQRADRNARAAAVNEALADERLWQTRRDQAANALHDGHGYNALPGLAANIAEREAKGFDASEDRLRFATIERNAPRLIDVIATGVPIASLALSPDGRTAAIAGHDESLRLVDLESGRERWRTSLQGVTHFWKSRSIRPAALAFSTDGRRLIARQAWPTDLIVAPFGVDEILVDAADGHVLAPERFDDFRDATYSPDGGYAMVRNQGWEAALVRTSDWAALGPRRRVADAGWLLTAHARALASTPEGFKTLLLHDPRTLAIRHRFPYTEQQRITAWAGSPDGRALAIGHLDGLVEYIDCVSGRRTRVSQNAGGRVAWLAFDAEGRWFGAAITSGEARVWDRATLRPVAPVIRPQTATASDDARIAIDAANRSVLLTVGAETSLWRLDGDHAAPQRIDAQFPHASLDTELARAAALDPAHGLVASGGLEGELRLWRVPRGTPHALHGPAIAGPLRMSTQVIAADNRGAQVVDVRSGAGLSPRIVLAQAPSFAETTADETTLVLAVANEILIHDTKDWTRRLPPLLLPNDPMRIALSPDSRHAYAGWADYRDGREVEVGRVFDLGSGETIGETVFQDVDEIAYTPDAQHLLLLWQGELAAVDALTLAPRWHLPTDSYTSIAASAFAANGRSLWTLALSSNPASAALWRVEPRDGTIVDHIDLGELAIGSRNLLPVQDDNVIMQRPEGGPVRWNAASGAHRIAGLGSRESLALALAPDGRVFARATRTGVVLASTTDGQWLSPELRATALDDDFVTQLAFTSDGNGMVGRSLRNRWLYWDTAIEPRPAPQLQRLAHWLSPDATRLKNALAPPLTPSERAELRALDTPAPAPVAEETAEIPQRRADLPPTLVDFDTQPRRPLQQPGPQPFKLDLPGFVPGRHRLLGVDYDARSHLLVRMQAFGGGARNARQFEELRPGIARIAALDMLLEATTTLQLNQPLPYAFVELRYRDGSRARLPILYRRDVLARWIDKVEPGTARTAWRQPTSDVPNTWFFTSRVYSVRLANPHPEREVERIALQASEYEWSQPAFLAITVEPATVPH